MKPWLYCAALSGMTSLAFLAINANAKTPSVTQALSQTSPVEEFIVRGNEPFWGMTVGRRGIVYTTPETKPRTFPYVAPSAAQGRPLDVVRVYRLQGGANNLLIIKKVDACSDQMSDRQSPYSATLILGNTVREGCAQRKP